MSTFSIQNNSSHFDCDAAPRYVATAFVTLVGTAIIRNPCYPSLAALLCFAGATYLNTNQIQHRSAPAIKMIAATMLGFGLRHTPILYPALFITGIMLWNPKRSFTNNYDPGEASPRSPSSTLYNQPYNPNAMHNVSFDFNTTVYTQPPQQTQSTVSFQSLPPHALIFDYTRQTPGFGRNSEAGSPPPFAPHMRAMPEAESGRAFNASPSRRQDRAMLQEPGEGFDAD